MMAASLAFAFASLLAFLGFREWLAQRAVTEATLARIEAVRSESSRVSDELMRLRAKVDEHELALSFRRTVD